MNINDIGLERFYTFPESMQGALKVTPLFSLLFYTPFLFLPFDFVVLGVVVTAHTILMFLFFHVYWLKGYWVTIHVVTMVILAVFVSFFSVSCIGFFAYAAAACSAFRKRLSVLFLLLTVVISYLLVAYLQAHSVYVLLVGLFFTLINGINFDVQFRHFLKNRNIKQSQNEVRNLAQVDERERIARDLHDVLGNSLTSITLKAELAERLMDVNLEEAKIQIKHIQEISREALGQVRETVTEYKANTIENELSHARIALQSKDISLKCEIEPLIMPTLVESVFSMVVREAVTNILRHSEANRCTIRLEKNQGYLALKIVDNGASTGEVVFGNGLKGMKERINTLGGWLEVEMKAGLRICVSFAMAEISERVKDD